MPRKYAFSYVFSKHGTACMSIRISCKQRVSIQCTMRLSPLQSVNRTIYQNVFRAPHFFPVPFFQMTNIWRKFLITFILHSNYPTFIGTYQLKWKLSNIRLSNFSFFPTAVSNYPGTIYSQTSKCSKVYSATLVQSLAAFQRPLLNLRLFFTSEQNGKCETRIYQTKK